MPIEFLLEAVGLQASVLAQRGNAELIVLMMSSLETILVYCINMLRSTLRGHRCKNWRGEYLRRRARDRRS